MKLLEPLFLATRFRSEPRRDRRHRRRWSSAFAPWDVGPARADASAYRLAGSVASEDEQPVVDRYPRSWED